MPDITITPKPESTSVTVVPANRTVSLNIVHLNNICAVGLGVSFLLPWVRIFGVPISGFKLQKGGNGELLLWAIPIFCVITIIAGFAKQSQKHIAQIAGALPYVVGMYWYFKLKDDFFHILAFGAFLSLAFGVVLFILPRNSK